MKRIVVTGGSGRLGIKVIDELVTRGFDVLSVDIKRPEKYGCAFLPVDLTNAAAVQDVLAGSDGVIHLGAIPRPASQPQSVTFQNNVQSTWNVAHSAAVLGLPRLVFASSVFALGWHESAAEFWPQYVPVDEDHPLTPFEAYGLSKVIGEETIAAACRRSKLTAVSLRIMNIIQEDGYSALPWPIPTKQRPARFVLWPYIDVRDAAVACCQALDAEIQGHEAVYIAAEDIRFDAPVGQLLREFAPNVAIRTPLSRLQTVISIEKARRLLGFRPEFTWRKMRPSENS
ncbi:MAG: NAD(P)-dependent oxidoreductase [Planctomycetaceae bacterium]